jgi:RNase P/RNase MRP subunit POP5
MVRFKTRWLLVQMEATADVNSPITSGGGRRLIPYTVNDSDHNFPSKKDFMTRLRKTISWCFGLAGEPMGAHLLVKFYDPSSQLVLIRCPRQYCGQVRVALTLFLTPQQMQQQQQQPSNAAATTDSSSSNKPSSNIMCSVLSVHGSTRTAKIAIIRRLRDTYRQKLLAAKDHQTDCINNQDALCRELHDRLSIIISID